MERRVGVLLFFSSVTVASATPLDLDRAGALVEVLGSAPAGRHCSEKAGVCFFAGAGSTVAVDAAVAAATVHGSKGSASVATVPPRFARTAPIAGVAATVAGKSTASTQSGSWSIEVLAVLKRPAWAGNALFLLYDTEDPNAVANREVTAYHQASVRAGRTVAARLTLSPDDGFRVNHTYRLRVVQLIGGKEIVLAEGDVTLL